MSPGLPQLQTDLSTAGQLQTARPTRTVSVERMDVRVPMQSVPFLSNLVVTLLDPQHEVREVASAADPLLRQVVCHEASSGQVGWAVNRRALKR